MFQYYASGAHSRRNLMKQSLSMSYGHKGVVLLRYAFVNLVTTIFKISFKICYYNIDERKKDLRVD